MCRTRVKAVTGRETRIGHLRERQAVGGGGREQMSRFFRHTRVQATCERSHTCGRSLDRSQANAQYAATCAAHRRIGRPRGHATALRRYNYLRAFLRRYNGYFAAVVYGN